mmetsp:Transcript_24885/g.30589  ORF Transcript_24885/g.30589 Transcript_24885/m.30589 type:complete len:244 (-) Transcript_24885:169-900(-)
MFIKSFIKCIGLTLLSAESFTLAFVIPGSNSIIKPPTPSFILEKNPTEDYSCKQHISTYGKTSTSISMGYNLPPGGGGNNKFDDILPGIAVVAGVILFFVSPLGGIFFAITNSLFILALLTPILIGVGFNAWQYFNTIEGDCPSCSVPARVLKDKDAGPNVCLNCGSLIRATVDLDGIELCNNPDDIFDEKSRISSIFDIFTSDPSVYEATETETTATTSIFEDKKKQAKRESTIIDVDVERE